MEIVQRVLDQVLAVHQEAVRQEVVHQVEDLRDDN